MGAIQQMLVSVAGAPVLTNRVGLPLTYDEADAAGVMTWTRQGNGPHVTPEGFEGDGYEARLKSTTIPTWMDDAAEKLTLHASVRFYPQKLKSTSEFALYAGDGNASPASKLIICTIPDATNSAIPQLAIRGGTGGTGYVEKKFGRSNWRHEFRIPDLTVGGYHARAQCLAFIDSDTVIVSAHYENTMSRVWKIRLSDGIVLGYFDTATYYHLTNCAFDSNGDFWISNSGTFELLKVDLDSSFSTNTIDVLHTVTSSDIYQMGVVTFVTVSGTEYVLLPEYRDSGTPYLYVIPASALSNSTIAASDRYKRFSCGYEPQGLIMRAGKLMVSCIQPKGIANRYGYIQQFDIVTAITSTSDGGTITAESTWDAPSKYPEDIDVHPVTGDLWCPTEGIASVGSDDGAQSVWSSPLDGSLVENHYTCEYDGAGTTTIKINGHIYDTMPGTLAIDVAAVTIGGPPATSAGMTAGYFTGFVRNVVLQDQPMTTAEYEAAIAGDDEPNSLTAYNFTLTNPGAESGTSPTGWTNESGGLGVLTYPASTLPPHSGSRNFSGGTSASTIARQRLDVLAQTGLTGTDVDAGGIWAKVRWWQASYDSAQDPAGMGIRTLDGSNATIAEAYAGIAWTPNATAGGPYPWYPRAFSASLGLGTRSIDALQKMTRTSGTNNDGWIDDISVTVYRQ